MHAWRDAPRPARVVALGLVVVLACGTVVHVVQLVATAALLQLWRASRSGTQRCP